MAKVLALTVDGELTYCSAPPERRGKGRCKHVAHACENESLDDFMVRCEKYIATPKNNPAINKEHNRKTYEDLMGVLEKHDSCAIVAPTGTGKSCIFSAILDDYKDKKNFIVFPKEAIRDYFVSAISKYPELNPIAITYQDLHAKMKKIQSGEITPIDAYGVDKVGVLICDELHRSASKEWFASINKFREVFKVEKFIGGSATVVREDGINVVDLAFDGRFVGGLTLEECVEDEILPRPRYISVEDFDFDSWAAFGKDLESECSNMPSEDSKPLLKEFRESMAQSGNILSKSEEVLFSELDRKIDEEDGHSKILITAENIKAADNDFGYIRDELISKYGEDKVEFFSYHSKNKKNKEVEEKFKQFTSSEKSDKIQVCVAVDMFNEGVHAPDLNTIIMARKTDSEIIKTQQIGRVLSLSNENPLVIDLCQNVDDKLTNISSNKSETCVDGYKAVDQKFIQNQIMLKAKYMTRDRARYNIIDGVYVSTRDELSKMGISMNENHAAFIYNKMRNGYTYPAALESCVKAFKGSEEKKRLDMERKAMKKFV